MYLNLGPLGHASRGACIILSVCVCVCVVCVHVCMFGTVYMQRELKRRDLQSTAE